MARTELKNLPAKEVLWVNQNDGQGNQYYITSDIMRTKYHLWKSESGKYVKIAEDDTPVSFDGVVAKNATTENKKGGKKRGT